MNFLKKLLGIKPNPLIQILANGASIIDVRTAQEYKGGHIDGAINIPLDQIKHKIKKIKQLKSPVVLYCASGMRSGTASSILKRNNINEVYNGGSWSRMYKFMNAS